MFQKEMSFITRVSLILMCSKLVNASEVSQWVTGARAMGMGRSSIAVVNDETALLSNPAGLGKIRDFYGTILDPEIEGSVNAYTLYSANAYSPFDPASVNAALQSSPGAHYHARAQLFPSIVYKNFGIGVFGRYVLDAEQDATQTNLQTKYQDDLAIMLGYNLRFFDGRIKIGVVGKAISRIEIDKNLPVSGPLDVKSNASEGAAIGADVGIILAAPWTWIPTLAAVVRDIGGTNFEAGSSLRMDTSTRPKKVEQDYDLAIALFPIHGNRTRSSFTVEANKIVEAGKAIDKTRYIHAGYEFNYGDLFFVRAGINQRYWTAGLELASEYTQLQIATYGEDIGLDGSPKEDRRLVFKFSLRF